MPGDDQSPTCQEMSEEPEHSSEMKVKYWTMFLRQTKSDCWVYLYSHANDLAGKTNAPHMHSPDVYIMLPVLQKTVIKFNSLKHFV